ncbi:hypothetical protein GW17_00013827 [Ensete ventricosum]|nr:hypothetical protein GW17_00013827 [Ensete ventricosum]
MKGLLLTPFLIISVLHVCSCIPDVQVENDCSVAPLPGGGSVEVKFPFRLNDQPASCGFQGFELYNHGDSNMLKLPFDQPLAVDYISYSTQMLSVFDPDGCLFRRLLYLNLSASPFTLGDDEIGYYYKPINCSSETSPFYLTQVSCLSDLPGYYYLADSSLPTQLLSSCETLTKDQFKLSADGRRLFLAWDEPDCRNCNRDCRLNRKSNKTKCVPYPTSYDDPYIYGSSYDPYIYDKGLCAAVSVAIATITILLVYRRFSKMKKKKQNLAVELFLKEYKSMKPTRYAYPELKKMTDDFKTILGQGGYGSVFQGKLHNGVPVAVKVLDNPTVSGDEFTNEIAAIGTVHHVNIVRILGFCVEGSKRALIYEFMPNQSLDKYVMEEGEKSSKFSWTKLQDISMGIARGIEYLHQGCEQRILHLDIKPQNILLDQEFNPKISDFGLAKLCSKERSAVSMTAARGTMGYMAPEVFLGSNKTVSHRSDVYSFGMVLMEMVAGRKNTAADEGENAAQIYFPEWIYNQLKQGEELRLVTGSVEDAEIAKKLTMVALWCVQWRPVDRPSMKVAVQMLEGSLEMLPLPPNPFAPHVGKK